MKRRQAVVLTLSLSLLLSACSSANDGQKHLTLAINSGVEGDALRAAGQDYEEQFNVDVTIAEFPYANLFEKELVDLVNHTGAYDLIMLDDPWFPRFAAGGTLTDLIPLYQRHNRAGPDDDFVASSLALCRHPYTTGKLYALPYVGNAQLFFYRQDLFEKYRLSPPETWDDVLTAARTINQRENMYGYVMRAQQGNPVVADFLPIFWAFGAEMFDAEGHPTVNSRQGMAALRMMVELGGFAPPGYASFNADEVAAHLLQGTAAMSINWPAWIPAFSDPAKSRVMGKIEITTLPGQKQPGRAEIGNWLIAIPRSAHDPETAFEFLLWATSAGQMKQSALRGNPPTRVSLFQDAELVARYPSYPVQLRSLQTSRPRPRTPLWNEIENAFGIFLTKATTGELSPEEAMNQANAALTQILKRGQ